VYDGSDLYDFRAALASARGVSPVTLANSFATDDSLYFRQLRKIDTRGRSTLLATPTGDGLHKHAQRFGPDQVRETAKLYGIDMRVRSTPKVKRQRRTSADLTAQVVELHARGVVEAAIADTLNVSDRRVGEILSAAAA